MQQDVIVSGILAHDGRVMLAKRALTKKIAPGMYHLPGGHVEFGEDPEQALIREFKEEFDLDVEIRGIVRAFSYVKDDLHTIGITYEVAYGTIPDVIPIDKNDTEEITWVDSTTYENCVNNNPSDHDRTTLAKYFSQ